MDEEGYDVDNKIEAAKGELLTLGKRIGGADGDNDEKAEAKEKEEPLQDEKYLHELLVGLSESENVQSNEETKDESAVRMGKTVEKRSENGNTNKWESPVNEKDQFEHNNSDAATN